MNLANPEFAKLLEELKYSVDHTRRYNVVRTMRIVNSESWGIKGRLCEGSAIDGFLDLDLS